MEDKHFEVAPDALPFNCSTNTTEVAPDAIPYNCSNHTSELAPANDLDSILNELSIDDFKSVFFLLLDTIGISDYLYLIKQKKEYLKSKFCEKYYELQYKEAVLIEILGTMQKFNLLKSLQTCRHVFENKKEFSFTHINPYWKCLYSVCEQLSDAQVSELKRKLLPNPSITITCAEQLFCEALQTHVFEVNDLKILADIFKNYPECYNLITSYKEKMQQSFYPIKTPTLHSHCGKAVIFCQDKFQREDDKDPHLDDRPDSRLDADALLKLWQSFGFETQIYFNYSDNKIKDLFTSLSVFDHSPYSTFVCCFLSHGDKGVVYASNSKPISINHLIDIMANNCPSLIGKPKLFFVQACQGPQVQEGIFMHTIEKEQVLKNSVDLSCSKLCRDTPIFIDVLLVESSIKGYASFYTPRNNSWFIGEFVNVMNSCGDNRTMLHVMAEVTKLVALKKGVTENGQNTNCKQTVVTTNTLRHKLKLKKRI